MTHKKSLLELEQSRKYDSVVIINCGCKISSILIDQHFSFAHAPSLPLQGCTAFKCTCEYKGITDRRLEDRRKSNSSTSIKVKNNRRIIDRRKIPLLILGDAYKI
ncbi:MAG: hypothetical protein KZQ83_09280 [gamma proteobacterium symbiont of Taylorina sp.]|nr:hypothetical protein [gamma proteobacterium symbiont of Taylorina sp.]